MRPRLYLCRHGQTDWNAAGRFQGQMDIPVNAVGEAQARANGERLAAILGDAAATFPVVASPMVRTRRTADLLLQALGRPDETIVTDDRLREVHFGDWQGQTFAEVRRSDPGGLERREADKWNFLPPGDDAESFARMIERVRPVLDGIVRSSLLVVHGGVTRCALRHLCGFSENRAAHADVPQDAVLRCDPDGSHAWV